MIEIRHYAPYWKKLNPDGSTAATGHEWQRSYLCIGGLRFGVVRLGRVARVGIRLAWRWSWRGIEVDTGPVRLYAGWMAPQFRESN